MDRSLPIRILVLFILVLFSISGSPATSGAGTHTPVAQSGPPAAPPASAGGAKEGAGQAPSEIAAIPLSDIPLRAEAAAKTLDQIQRELEPDPATVDILAKLPSTVRSLEQMRQGPEGKISRETSLQNLMVLRRQWALYRIQLGVWQGIVERRTQAMETARESLSQLRQTWEATERQAPKEAAPPALIQRVHSILSEIRTTEARLQSQRTSLLELQDQITTQLLAIDQTTHEIDDALARAQRSLFAIEGDPLWKPNAWRLGEISLLEQVQNTLQATQRSLDRFWSTYSQRVIAHAILFLALLWLSVALRHRSRRWTLENESLRSSAQILARPLSATLLVASIATLWAYPDAPREVYQVALLVMIVPMLRLLPEILQPRLRPILYGLAVLYVMDTVSRLVLPASSLIQRLLVLLVTALLFAGLVRYYQYEASATVAGERGLRTFRLTVSRLGIFILVASFIANVVGSVSLASLLMAGTLRSAYFAVVFFAGTRVLDGLLTGLLRTPFAGRFRLVQLHADQLWRRGIALVHAAALFAWLLVTCAFFGILGFLTDAVAGSLGKRWVLGTVNISLGDVLAFFLVLGISIVMSRLLRSILAYEILPHVDLPRGIPLAISTGLHYLVLAFGFYLAVGAAGVDMSRITLLAGALGVGIGFGLQNIVNNFLSGILLLFERPIQPGDVIELGAVSGEVKRIGIRSTTVQTGEGADVIIPNANLISREVVNWTLTDRRRRVDVAATVAYGSDPKQVMDILLQVARKYPDVLATPEPMVVFQGMGENSLSFSLRFWTANFDNWVNVKTEVTAGVYKALIESGIAIPTGTAPTPRPSDTQTGGPSH
jgi:potassium-dependent mechanosensitive channel